MSIRNDETKRFLEEFSIITLIYGLLAPIPKKPPLLSALVYILVSGLLLASIIILGILSIEWVTNKNEQEK